MRGLASIASGFASLAGDFSIFFKMVNKDDKLLLLITLTIFTTVLSAQNPNPPSYSWENSFFLGNAGINTTQNLVIAIDTDSEGNVYYLTFGAGVFRLDPSTGKSVQIINDLPEEKGVLNGPLDMVIDSDDIIYIADSGSKLIKKFDINGNPNGSIGSGSGGNGRDEFWEPTGLAVDNENNLYIVDAYRGNDSDVTDKYFLKIYYSSGDFETFQGTDTHPLFEPYRVDANDQYIVISHAGNEGEVLVFDQNLQYIKTLTDVGSPGSVVIDPFGFIHVIDYGDNIDFSKVLAFETLNTLEILNLYSGIQSGIDKGEMVIQIYDPLLNHKNTLNDLPGEDNIQLPIDITFNNCSSLFIDDGKINGLSLDFDLEIYERTPSFDTEDPVAICIPAGNEFELVNGSVTITAAEIDNGSTDNCGIASMNLSQSTFTVPGDYNISLTVTDFSGNTNSCITTITIVTPASELTIGCPDDELRHRDENCQFVVPDYTALASPSNPEAVVTQFPVEGTVIEEDTEVILTATLGDLTATCKFQLEIIDRSHVEFSCPTDITEAYDSSEGYMLPNYTQQISLHDNCDPDPIITQEPAPGTIIFEEETEIVIRVEDASGNVSVCSFDLKLTDESEPLQFTDCPTPGPVVLKDNCQFVIPNYTSSAETNAPEAVITQTPPAGEVIQGVTSVEVILTATLGEEMVTCAFSLQLIDRTPPDMACPEDMVETYDPAVGYVIPEYASLVQGEDSCGNFSTSQYPAEGTLVFGDTPIQLNFTDASGNSSFCDFQLILEESGQPSYECPEPDELPFVELNEECKVEAGDYSDLLAPFEGFENEPYFLQTSSQNLNILSVHIEVYDGEGGTFVGECNFDIPLVDSTPPVIDCPSSTINLSPDENGNYILPDYRNRASDTCDSTLDITQSPPPGEITTGGTVTLSASDDSGNTSETCEFEVVLLQEGTPSFKCFEFEAQPQIVLNENCSFGDPDFSDLVSNFRNFQDSPLLFQTLQVSGNMLQVNIKVYDGKQEENLLVGECSFEIQMTENIAPEAACVQAISIRLDQNGSRSITPEEIDNGSTDGCGIESRELSRNTFTTADLENSPVEVELTVTDVYGNTDSCSVLVTVEPYIPGEPESVTCVTSITLPLNANGEAQLDVEQLYEGDLGPEGAVTVNKELFTCEDLGEQMVLLEYSGSSTGSCNIQVLVVDEMAPTPIARELEISLDEDGTASITAEDLNNGSTDNCGTSELQYEVNQSTFNCTDVGSNSISFTVTDAAGNSASTTVNVMVSDPLGECAVDPVPPEESFVFLLPNPSRGQVQFATSSNVVLSRVEIFDIRGRFLEVVELIHNPVTRSYHLDLQKYQTGVYTLKLYSEEREYIRRAIITTF